MRNMSGALWAAALAMGAMAACSDSNTTHSPGHGGAAGEGIGADAGAVSDAGTSTHTAAGSSADSGNGGRGGGADDPPGVGGAAAGAGDAGDTGGAGDAAGAGGAAPSTELATSAAFCDTYAAELCSWAEDCRSFADCKTWGGYVAFTRECADARASETAGFVSFVPDEAASCMRAVRKVTGGCVLGGPPFNNTAVLSACRDVFRGSVKLGKQCTSGDFPALFDECEEGYCNRYVGDVQQCLGKCAAYLQAGDACLATVPCAPGLYCNDEKCGPALGVGEACATGTCQTGLSCVGTKPTCRELRPAGGACNDDYDCVYPGACVDHECAVGLGVGAHCVGSQSCQASLYCDLSEQDNWICAPRIAAGVSCDPNSSGCVDGYTCAYKEGDYVCSKPQGALNEPCGFSGCEAGLWCEPALEGPGTCRARVPLNGACSTTAACAESLYCVGAAPSHCGPPGAAGAACSPLEPSSCTGDLFCARDTVKCTAPRALGQTCNPISPSTSCQSGSFCACLSPSCPSITSGHQAQDVCVQKRADGQACAGGHECQGGFCTSDKCASVAPPSSNCTR